MPVDRREERRRNAKALGVVAIVLLAFGALAYRPAIVIGVDGDALANSVGGGDVLGDSECVEVSENRWRCQLIFGSDGSVYAVHTRAFGCWDATRLDVTGEHGVQAEKSGCVNGLDVVSPF